MSWNKFWEYAKNTAKTIYILILIGIGIRILWFVLSLFIPYKTFSPFETPDYNPLATLVGAIITGIIAWVAIFKTSELDRKSRVYEINYKYFREQLFELMKTLYPISRLSSKFKKFSHQNIPTSSSILQEDLFDYNHTIGDFINVYDLISRINPKFTEKIEIYKTQIESLFDLRQYFCEKLSLHRCFMETKDEQYKINFIEEIEDIGEKRTIIHFSLNELLSSFKSEKNIDYDNLYTEECIKKIRDAITEQLKLEE